MKRPELPKSEHLLLAGFAIGLSFLAYVFAAAVFQDNGWVRQAVEAGKTWNRTLKEADTRDLQDKSRIPLAIDARSGAIAGSTVGGNIDLAEDGYTLISLRFSTSVYLLDMKGRVVHQWDMPFSKAWPNPAHVHSLARARVYIDKAYAFPNGDLLVQYMGAGDTPYGYGMAKMDKDSNLLWTYSDNAHHDFTVARDGTIYTLAHRLLKEPVKGAEFISYPILSDFIVTLSPDGKELDRISILEALRDSPYEPLLHKPKKKRSKAWDYFHTNTVVKLEPETAGKFPQFKAGHILISMRNLDTIAVVDPDSRKAVWAYRGPWHWQHAAGFLPNGRLIVMDNLGQRTSRVLEFSPETLDIAWDTSHYQSARFHTGIFGRVQRLPGGNTLIAATMTARILEVTPDGELAWDYRLPAGRGHANGIIGAARYRKKELPFLKP